MISENPMPSSKVTNFLHCEMKVHFYTFTDVSNGWLLVCVSYVRYKFVKSVINPQLCPCCVSQVCYDIKSLGRLYTVKFYIK